MSFDQTKSEINKIEKRKESKERKNEIGTKNGRKKQKKRRSIIFLAEK